MKKLFCLLLATLMVIPFVFTGCGDEKAEPLKFGLGVYSTASATDATEDKNGAGKATITAAAVTVDSNGKIVDCILDTADFSAQYTEDGKAVANESFQTKREQGDAYNMKAYGGAALEWYEQAAAFDKACVGKTADEIIAGIADIRSRIVLFACIDTLEYLYKGGRISHTVYKLGTLANIKPIITVEPDGTIGVPAKTMGMRKGMDQLCKQALAKPADPDFPFYVMYTNQRTVAEELAKKLASAGIAVDDSHIIQVGAAIGSHVGPDACGLVYVAK